MKKFLMCGLLSVLCVSLYAFQVKYGSSVTISEPVYHDLYIGAGKVVINAPIHGDLVVAGGTIQINDTVSQDILLAGGNVNFNGFVGDDIRCAGGNLKVLKNVAGDVVITGGNIEINKGVTIGGLICAGGDLVLDGIIKGMLKTTSGRLLLNGVAMSGINSKGGTIIIKGTVNGAALLAASDKLTIGEQAVFSETVHYWTPSGQVDFRQSVKTGKPIFDPSLAFKYGRWYFFGFSSLMGLLWYCGMVFLMIILIQFLFSSSMKKAGETAFNTPLKSFGYGILFWIALPVAAALLFVTVVGAPVGLLLFAGLLLLILYSSVITAVVFGNWLNGRTNSKWNYWQHVLASFGIFMVLKLVGITPFLGWLVLGILICIASGSLIQQVKFRKQGSGGT